jgi:hypothetical protein
MPPESLFSFSASLLTIAFTREGLLYAKLLTGLEVKGVPFHFPDDVFLQNFPFKAAQRVFQRLAFLEPYFSQSAPPTSSPRSGKAGRPESIVTTFFSFKLNSTSLYECNWFKGQK